MKRITAIVITIAFALCLLTLTSCSDGNNKTSEDSKLTIVTTIFPVYDWVNNITKGNEAAEVTMLLDSGADLHNYQPSAEDIIKITNCDVFIYIGGESDKWAEDVLNTKTNDDMVVLNLMETLGENAKEEELAEGMEAEEEAEEGHEYDEHIWLSVKNARFLVNEISNNLSELDAANSELYMNNTNEYNQKLDSLDKEYQKAADSASVKTLVFGDRFPFRYLIDDYGLSYYAAFIGCSAETEASFETISFLAQKVDELELNYVITLEGTDHKIAETVIQNTNNKNQTILSMNSMQSITSEDIKSGMDYISIMQSNLTVLEQALKNQAGED